MGTALQRDHDALVSKQYAINLIRGDGARQTTGEIDLELFGHIYIFFTLIVYLTTWYYS